MPFVVRCLSNVPRRTLPAITTALATRLLKCLSAPVLLFVVCHPNLALAQVTVQTFATFGGANGGGPSGNLVEGPDGALYGTTNVGGANGSGTVFRIAPGGTTTVLHSFAACCPPFPFFQSGVAGLMLASDGDLYGVTGSGGAHGWGTLFKITTAGTYTLLHSFQLHAPNGTLLDGGGGEPTHPPVERTPGQFFLTTDDGGIGGSGSIFSATSDGEVAAIYQFPDMDDPAAGGFEEHPGPLVDGQDGFLYGAGFNTVFRVTPAGLLTVLHTFAAEDPVTLRRLEGVGAAYLIRGADGSFYGVNRFGGIGGNGTIFRVTAAGSFALLHDFAPYDSGVAPDGAMPVGLTQGPDGHLYGVTRTGGAADGGVLFRITTGGAFSRLYDFPAAAGPSSALLLGSDNALYGTTMTAAFEGNLTSDSAGTVFRVTGLFESEPPPPVPCTIALDSGTQLMDPQGGIGAFTVTTQASCVWSAITTANWISILPGGYCSPNGDVAVCPMGSRKVAFTVAANAGGTRSGMISVGDEQFDVVQNAASACEFLVSPLRWSPAMLGSTRRVDVIAPARCRWAARSNAAWLTLTGGALRSGSGSVYVAATANTADARTGTATIAGQTFTVSQDASACGAIDITRLPTTTVRHHGLDFYPPALNFYEGVRIEFDWAFPDDVYLVIANVPHDRPFPDAAFLTEPGWAPAFPHEQPMTTCFSPTGDYLFLLQDAFSLGGTRAGITLSLFFSAQSPGAAAMLPGYSVRVLRGRPSR